MLEWNDKYNPFNSDKILIWREWLEGCAKSDFLPPITIDIDPSARCNLNCIWCNFADFNKDINQDIPPDHLLRIADFAAEWGVKSAHILGGGEPLMNPGVCDLLYRLHVNGTQAGMITNGVLLNDKLIEAVIKTCRWIGISLDAGTVDTYCKVKGIEDKHIFERVLKNIQKLCIANKQAGNICSVCVKYLLHPSNVNDIAMSASLAKSLGVNDFQIRPAGWENITNKKAKPFSFTGLLDIVDAQVAQAQTLETNEFHVYGIRHKFMPDIKRKINYTKCRASPIVLIFGADGNCYVCGDRRGQKEFVLCSHYPDVREVLKYWNTDKHKQIISSVKLSTCPRCVLGPYHEIIEKVFVRDQMCRNFP